MVERRICSFCGEEIEPGTGRMFVKKDGTILQFCNSKCYKNMIELRRIPRRTAWTAQFYREKETKLKSSGQTAEKMPTKKVKEKSPAKKGKGGGSS